MKISYWIVYEDLRIDTFQMLTIFFSSVSSLSLPSCIIYFCNFTTVMKLLWNLPMLRQIRTREDQCSRSDFLFPKLIEYYSNPSYFISLHSFFSRPSEFVVCFQRWPFFFIQLTTILFKYVLLVQWVFIMLCIYFSSFNLYGFFKQKQYRT